ncbi:uracil-DNA glycosylase [Hydrogenophaga electricum]|uniref:Uracil-DNA glycosylase n=1 Tax=Hydrogenophaga electricum TaxID=1230953 RepID=A0ABQ6CE61_9BURK|nr:uracil-DNA glycosylase [Hydrogenophaga electricum]GLS16626.1 uracil-DNA glycosylase [Hydrogenophaga electricum]
MQTDLWEADAPDGARLRQAEPGDRGVQPDWQPWLDRFWDGQAGQGLLAYLHRRLAAGAVIYPPQPLRALALTAMADVRVVILGQDPYHGPGQAEGLAFSVAPGVRVPPSLRNIRQELQRDLGLSSPDDGSLVRWAEQGVLLLNTTLTVEAGQAGSHAGRGWEVLTDSLIDACNAQGRAKLFLLWGAHAQKKAARIDAQRHQVLTANHPSPLSARRGPEPFLGCGHFGAVNAWLSAHGQVPINW